MAEQPAIGVPAAEYHYYQPSPQVFWTKEDSRGCGSWTCNILWFIFGGGILMGLLWGLCGCLLCITLVCIPCGLNCFKIAGFAFFPFGKMLKREKDVCACPQSCGNLLWLPLGVILFLAQVSLGIAMFLSIIGIPFGIQHFKLSLLCLWPMGTIVTAEKDIAFVVQQPPQIRVVQPPQQAPVHQPPPVV